MFDLRSLIESIARFFHVEYTLLIRKVISVGLIWLGAWIANWLIKVAARRILKAVDDGDDSTLTLREKRGQTVAQLLRSVGRVVVIVVSVLLTLNVFIEITPLLAGAGILGLAVSFGAQSLVKDVIAGFFILLENQFAVGDVIEASGKGGVVERMTLRVVQLRDLEGILHTIPNGSITVVSNRTRGWSTLRPHDAPWPMATALVVLALGSILAGYVGVPHALGGHNNLGAWHTPVFNVENCGQATTSGPLAGMAI